ncbi:23S rRNA (adenine(2030)-N(6))-methyltransferase RlmJ [Pseudoroseicyclus aestuarii]|uniref:Ribosomal RNA large subunit methyltransferase J n=1 Tax=Pseudoroseicyclus aestuarii TaxID=1795041 RepID=A0A318SUW0_9RHOB|nr:23S rRNA (adenine(2030)-N(6))-methyltransferase RlmJ [Pseudoroseicyclus aestuarii]PYE85700.1 23S rRNA (adenine2030-N6)-methyltransferase [Pseudoroseicyclus aestuarii]
MLSYQHAYHAGNLADVHKHAVLAWILSRMTSKAKPISYIETHAGRGLYDLAGQEAAKTGEAAGGIARSEDWFPAAHPYARAIAAVRAKHGAAAYPGSPMIAALTLREGDRGDLAELHPAEHAALTEALAPWPLRVHKRDGGDLALSLAPPEPRRGLCLIDPSWEVKEDYRTIPRLTRKLHKAWPVGVLMLWYPLLDGRAEPSPHAPMLRALEPDLTDAVRHEVRFPPAREGHRMAGSGLLIVNPPYGLHRELESLSARFAML